MLRLILCAIPMCGILILLKNRASEFILPAEILFAALSLVLIYNETEKIISALSDSLELLELDSGVVLVLLKGALICIITKIAGDACADSGNRLLSGLVELSGRVSVILLAFPYIESVLRLSLSFIK